jgi:cysteine desulfuration protein SufE
MTYKLQSLGLIIDMNYFQEINSIIEDFSFFESWEDKFQYLIDLGRNVPAMDASLKVDKNTLKGCQSVVYFCSFENQDGTIKFLANSDAAIVQGLIGLMLKVFSDRTAQEIIDINIKFFMFNAYAYTRITNS